MPTAEGFSFWNFLADVITIFFFVVWFWLLIIIFSDLFRRHDISGLGKALWVIALLLFSYLGVFIYLITQSRGMAERNLQQAQRARDELRQVVGFSAADEIKKLDELKKSGAISDAEFARLRGQSLAYVYGRETKADADIANVLTMDEARWVASNIAKLPALLGADKLKGSRTAQ
jgi:hypothetical protein